MTRREAVAVVLTELKRELLDVQQQILRAERFGGDAVGDAQLCDLQRASLEDLLLEHREQVAQIREVAAIAQHASEEAIEEWYRRL